MEVKSLEEILKNLDAPLPTITPQYQKNIDWLIQNRSRLSKYENNWLAIYQEDLIGFSPNPTELEQQLRDKNIDPALVVFHFLVNSNCIL